MLNLKVQCSNIWTWSIPGGVSIIVIHPSDGIAGRVSDGVPESAALVLRPWRLPCTPGETHHSQTISKQPRYMPCMAGSYNHTVTVDCLSFWIQKKACFLAMISCISQKQSGREGVWEKLTLLLVLVRYINSLKWEQKNCIHIQSYCSWIRCIYVILQVLLHHKKFLLKVSALYKYLPYNGTHYIQKCELYSVKVWQWRLQTRASMAARWRRWQRRGPCTKTGGSW